MKRQDAARRRMAARSLRTRALLIEEGGRLFAEFGFNGATGKEICRQAGVHTSAIVYHFGGLAGLYRAVLEEARRRLLSTEALAAAVNAESDPRRTARGVSGNGGAGVDEPGIAELGRAAVRPGVRDSVGRLRTRARPRA